MFESLFRKSLLAKFSTIVIGVTLVSIVFLSTVLILGQRADEQADIEARAVQFGQFATSELYAAYIESYAHPAESSFRVFTASLREVLAANPDIRRVVLIAVNGRILFDSVEVDAGAKYSGPDRFITDADLLAHVRRDELSTRHMPADSDGTEFQVIAPVRVIENVHALSMVYSVSLESLRQRQSALLRSTLLVSTVPLALGILLPLLVLPGVIRPLRELKEAAQKVSAGNFDVHITTDTGDEIADLGMSFKHMVTELMAQTDELAQRADEAEQSQRAITNVLEDLTQAKADLEDAHAFDAALLASLADGLVAIDTAGRITAVNQAAMKLLGRTYDALVGKSVAEAIILTDATGAPVPANDRPVLKALQLSQGQAIRDTDHFLFRPDGIPFPVAIDVAPIIIGGATAGSISVFRDITQEKEIDRAKSEFVSLASHQLRTPLTSIGWYTELLLTDGSENLTPAQRESLSQIKGQNKRMVDLVNALLDVSRLELGTLVAKSERTMLVPLIKELVAQYRPQAAEHGVRIIERYDEHISTVAADQRLLTVILENLISNAVKYTKQGEITISAALDGDTVVYTVADTGIGIPTAEQSKVFSKLFRADNAKLSNTDGNGLGLYLVRSILDRLSGTITFASKEGEGSTFTVRFPLNAELHSRSQAS